MRGPRSGGVRANSGGTSARRRPSAGSSVCTAEHSPKEGHRWPCPSLPCPNRVALQELIELEATERIGAAPYERTEDRTTERKRPPSRILMPTAGDVELRIPKLR